MKRNLIVSAVALVAVLGTGAYAQGMNGGMKDGPRGPMGQMGMQMTGMMADMAFDKVDTDGDGQITVAEAEAFKAARFAEMDANGDGSVDADELVAHQEAKRAERMKTMAEKMVAKRDTDGDGVLSAEELTAPPKQKTMFERLDKNEDGVLTQDELKDARKGMGGDRFGDRGQPRMMGQGGHGSQGHAKGHGGNGPCGGQPMGQPPMPGDATAAPVDGGN